MSYRIQMTRDAVKDYEKIKKSEYHKVVKQLLNILMENPLQYPPPYEQLKGDLYGYYSRRINKQHRLVYTIHGDIVIIKSMWTHYEKL